MKYHQQGDVLIKSIKEVPSGDRTPKENLVLAYGEVTGHSHQIILDKEDVPNLRYFTVGGMTIVESEVPFTVVHEEHKPISIPAGIYEIGIVKEYDHFLEESRNVID